MQFLVSRNVSKWTYLSPQSRIVTVKSQRNIFSFKDKNQEPKEEEEFEKLKEYLDLPKDAKIINPNLRTKFTEEQLSIYSSSIARYPKNLKIEHSKKFKDPTKELLPRFYPDSFSDVRTKSLIKKLPKEDAYFLQEYNFLDDVKKFYAEEDRIMEEAPDYSVPLIPDQHKFDYYRKEYIANWLKGQLTQNEYERIPVEKFTFQLVLDKKYPKFSGLFKRMNSLSKYFEKRSQRPEKVASWTARVDSFKEKMDKRLSELEYAAKQYQKLEEDGAIEQLKEKYRMLNSKEVYNNVIQIRRELLRERGAISSYYADEVIPLLEREREIIEEEEEEEEEEKMEEGKEEEFVESMEGITRALVPVSEVYDHRVEEAEKKVSKGILETILEFFGLKKKPSKSPSTALVPISEVFEPESEPEVPGIFERIKSFFTPKQVISPPKEEEERKQREEELKRMKEEAEKQIHLLESMRERDRVEEKELLDKQKRIVNIMKKQMEQVQKHIQEKEQKIQEIIDQREQKRQTLFDSQAVIFKIVREEKSKFESKRQQQMEKRDRQKKQVQTKIHEIQKQILRIENLSLTSESEKQKLSLEEELKSALKEKKLIEEEEKNERPQFSKDKEALLQKEIEAKRKFESIQEELDQEERQWEEKKNKLDQERSVIEKEKAVLSNEMEAFQVEKIKLENIEQKIREKDEMLEQAKQRILNDQKKIEDLIEEISKKEKEAIQEEKEREEEYRKEKEKDRILREEKKQKRKEMRKQRKEEEKKRREEEEEKRKEELKKKKEETISYWKAIPVKRSLLGYENASKEEIDTPTAQQITVGHLWSYRWLRYTVESTIEMSPVGFLLYLRREFFPKLFVGIQKRELEPFKLVLSPWVINDLRRIYEEIPPDLEYEWNIRNVGPLKYRRRKNLHFDSMMVMRVYFATLQHEFAEPKPGIPSPSDDPSFYVNEMNEALQDYSGYSNLYLKQTKSPIQDANDAETVMDKNRIVWATHKAIMWKAVIVYGALTGEWKLMSLSFRKERSEKFKRFFRRLPVKPKIIRSRRSPQLTKDMWYLSQVERTLQEQDMPKITPEELEKLLDEEGMSIDEELSEEENLNE